MMGSRVFFLFLASWEGKKRNRRASLSGRWSDAMEVTSCSGDTPSFFFFLDQTIKLRQFGGYFLSDLYRLALFLVGRFWDVAK